MAVQNPYLSNDGDINQAKRKRAGETLSIDAVPKQASAPVVTQQAAAPGNPARAARMQAQFSQPVTAGLPAGGLPAGASPSGTVGKLKDAYSAVSPLLNPVGTAVDVLTAAPADALRNTVIRAAGGDPATSEGGETANRDRAYGKIKPAVDAVQGAGTALRDGIKGGILSATGASPAQPSMPTPGKPSAPNSPPAQVEQAPERQAPRSPAASSPYFATDSGIAVRRNESGVTEFSNDPQALANAKAMPAGGIGGQTLRTPGVSNMADDVALEQRGSASNLGNGVGTFSQMQDGDSALALGRFERANQIREQTIQASRRGGIGEGGGRVTVVRDSSRAPSIAETLRDRQDSRLAQTEATRSKTEQGIMAGADQLMNSQINRQKTQQEIETGQAGLENQQRIADLRSKIADTTLPVEQRLAAEQAYNALTLSPADRYMTVQGGTNEFGGKDASKVFDRLTGKEVGAGQGAQPRKSVSMSEVEATAKARGMTPEQVTAALEKQGVTVSR